VAIGGLLLVSYGYFALCRATSMFVAWGFLFGYPFGVPWALLAARAAGKGRVRWAAGWTLAGFAAFFWGGQALVLWKTARGP
jgi:hypothetical protein